MKLAESRITRQGQLSVPAEVRRRLGLRPGSILEWDLEGDQVVVRRGGRHTSLEIHDVLFAERPERRTIEEMDAGIRRRAQGKHARR